MRRLIEKVNNFNAQTELNLTVFSKDGAFVAGNKEATLGEGKDNKNFTLFYGDSWLYFCVPAITDDKTVALIRAYFSEFSLLNCKNQEITAFLTGRLSPLEQVMLEKKLSGKKFLPVVLVVKDVNKKADLLEYLSAISSKGDQICFDDQNVIFLKSDDGEYDSGEEFSWVLYEAIKQEQNVELSVCYGGKSNGISGFTSSIKRAYEAYKILSPITPVCVYKNCAERVLFESLSQNDRREYLNFMLDGVKNKAIFFDKESVLTAKCLMKNSLSLSQTAKELFVHRNTLTHRIDKIESECGLDLRKYEDARIFETLSAIYSIARKNKEID